MWIQFNTKQSVLIVCSVVDCCTQWIDKICGIMTNIGKFMFYISEVATLEHVAPWFK